MKVHEIKKILEENETWAKKSFGQHFLVDERVLEKIVETAGIQKSDRILEIGPGLGVLTEKLLEKAGDVIAIEADKFLVGFLRNQFCHSCGGRNPDNHANTPSNGPLDPRRSLPRTTMRGGDDTKKRGDDMEGHLTLIEGDALKKLNDLDFIEKYLSKPYKVVANIPYSITSRFFRLLLENKYPPTSITCLIQREVAERIVAKPGQMSMLSVSVQYFGQPKIIAKVPASAFWPPPRVESAIMQTSNIIHRSNYSSSDPALLQKGLESREVLDSSRQARTIDQEIFRIARIGFSSRRKTLVNNLSAALRIAKDQVTDIIKSVGLKESVRAQELSVNNWAKLAQKLKTQKPKVNVRLSSHCPERSRMGKTTT